MRQDLERRAAVQLDRGHWNALARGFLLVRAAACAAKFIVLVVTVAPRRDGASRARADEVEVEVEGVERDQGLARVGTRVVDDGGGRTKEREI